MAPTKKSVPALKLNLGGAPASWHSVADLPGFYHPDIPTCVGETGECPLDVAKAAAEHEGAPVELVMLTEKDAENARAAQREQLLDARNALHRDGTEGLTRQQIDNELDALAGVGSEPAADAAEED